MEALIAAAAVAAGYFWWSSGPASKAAPPTVRVAQGGASGAASSLVSAVQAALGVKVSGTAARDAILTAFQRAGFSSRAGIAAAVNAYAESAWNPDAIGDGGHSVGLFQLHDNGAGKGMTTAQRQDPAQNIARILATVAGPQGAVFRSLDDIGASTAELVKVFARDIERCAACGDGGSEQARRLGLLAKLFPSEVA